MKRVLFVCSGNVFRSLIAKQFLESYLKKSKINGIKVDSAGTETPTENANKIVRAEIKKRGISFKHKPRKVSLLLLNKSDLVVSMGTNHKKILMERYGKNSVLFNRLAYGKNTGIPDIEEKYPHLWKLSKSDRMKRPEYIKRIKDVANHIYRGTPKLAEKIVKTLEL